MDLLVVAGGSGYIGSNLTEYLKEQLTANRSLLAIHRDKLILHTLSPLTGVHQQDYVTWRRLQRADIGNTKLVYAISEKTPNTTSVANSEELNTELNMVSLIVDSIRKVSSLKQIILLSSAGAFTYTDSLITNSSVSLPLSPYAVICALKERFFIELADQLNIQVCLARITNVYGLPLIKQRQQGLINRLLCDYIASSTTTITVPFKMTRNYIFMSDLCVIVGRLLDLVESRFPTGKFIIASSQNATIQELIDELGSVLQIHSKHGRLKIRKVQSVTQMEGFQLSQDFRPTVLPDEQSPYKFTDIHSGLQSMAQILEWCHIEPWLAG